MPDNYYSEINENGVVTPLRDLAAFPRSEQAVLGAKNLLPLTFSGDTQNNVVFTVDDDGVININGTNSGEAFAVIISPYSKWLKDGRYILNGCSGGSASTYKLDIDSPSGAFATNYDGDTEFTMVNGANNYRIRIVVYAGAVMNNVKIRPMIRLATDTDPNYVPYAMTNREMTEKQILTAYIEDTTTASSNLVTTLDVAKYEILCAYGASLLAMPYFYFDSGQGKNFWCFHVTDNALQNVVSTNVKIYYSYIKK